MLRAAIETRLRSRPETATVYIAGDYDQAMEAIRSWCTEKGDCWAVTRCEYVYTGGQEAGVQVTRIEYPRFPTRSGIDLQNHAEEMAEFLMLRLHQKSCSVVGPVDSIFLSRKQSD